MAVTKNLVDIESRSIEYIPLDERKGTGRDLWGIWFGFNMIPLAIVTGAIGISLELPFAWSVLAIILGNLLGGLTMGLHASQGPRLGVPQMLQARGQFGARGANILVVITLFVMVGYFTSNLVVGAQALTLAVPSVPTLAAIAVAAVVSLIVAAIGYTAVRRCSVFAAALVGIMGLALLVASIFFHDGSGAALGQGTFSVAGFFTVCMVSASWQVGFAPYVSDYSRYLPPNIGEKQAFWGTYGGCASGASILMILGAYLGTQAANGDPLAALHGAYGAIGSGVLILLFVASSLINSVNGYTATLCSLTLVQGFWSNVRITVRSKLAVMAVLHIAAFIVASIASADFLTYFLNFIYFLLYLLVPWSAINLADYFLIRHGEYDIDSFFAPDGGIYGRWNVRALVAYAFGIAVQLPFINTALYVGPVVAKLGGVDIAWIIGFVLSGAFYVVLARVGKTPVQVRARKTP